MAYTTIDDPSAYFQTATYSGSGGTGGHAIVNDGNSDLQPDLVWLKQRSYASSHRLMDSTRGGNKMLESDTGNAEATYGYISSFDTDGFTLGYSDTSFDGYGREYVAWQWKANAGSTSSNTSGTITSTVQANTDAGFSIVTYTGNGDPYGNTFGHGLGVAPKIVIVKRRSSAQSWAVYSEASGAGYYLRLNGTNGKTASSAHWYNTAPTSTLVYVGGNGEVNGSSETYVAYCFAEKQGFSKFGKYYGTNTTNGAFVYTGFKPAFVMMKVLSDPNYGWSMMDSTRSPYNQMNHNLYANSTGAESTVQNKIDFLSNGFKLRADSYPANAGGGNNYLYMAFAENPFVTSTGIPTTAR